jgi:hypothetical protein
MENPHSKETGKMPEAMEMGKGVPASLQHHYPARILQVGEGGNLEGEVDHSSKGDKKEASRLNRRAVALWLSIAAMILTIMLARYLLWAKLSFHSPS